MQDEVSFAELTDLLQHIGYPDSTSAFHGNLCGMLCVQAPEEIRVADLLEFVQQGLRADAPLIEAFERLRPQSLRHLMSAEMDFAPLLPDDEAPLAERVQALAAWCEGFLFGLASRRSLDLKTSSEEAREMIRDLTQFTQAGFEGDDQLEETAYTELVEYVRVGAQLLFMEFHPRGAPAASPDEHTLH